MSALIVPGPRHDRPYSEQTTTIEGVTYRITFDWLQRLGRWSMNIATIAGDPLVQGLTLVGGADILAAHVADPRVPQGLLFVHDLRGLRFDPGLDFRRSHVLLFFPLADALEPGTKEAQEREEFLTLLAALAISDDEPS